VSTHDQRTVFERFPPQGLAALERSSSSSGVATAAKAIPGDRHHAAGMHQFLAMSLFFGVA